MCRLASEYLSLHNHEPVVLALASPRMATSPRRAMRSIPDVPAPPEAILDACHALLKDCFVLDAGKATGALAVPGRLMYRMLL